MQSIALASAGVERYAGQRLPLRVYSAVLREFIRARDLCAAGLFREPAEKGAALAHRCGQGAYRAVGRDIGVSLGACPAVRVELNRKQAGAAAGFVRYVPYLRDIRYDLVLRAADARVVAERKLYALCRHAGVCAVKCVRRRIVVCQQHGVGDASVIDLNALGVLVQQRQQRGLFLSVALAGVAFDTDLHAHV